MYRFFAAAAALILIAVTTQASGAGTPLQEGSETGTLLAGTSSDVFCTIQGNALDAASRPLPATTVRLRDARSGRIVASGATDSAGLFVFRTLDPGSYVVELIGSDRGVLAASGIVNIDAGQTLSVIVKLPFRPPLLGGLLGHSVRSAAIVSAAAVGAGILAATVTGQPASAVR
jgi:hypothetical protein